MSWKNNLRPASFRGADFFIESAESTFGRKTVEHEFPGKSNPYVEDLGRAPRSFKIDGYIVGDDYFEKKNSLIEAAETAGPGELIHPYYGKIRGNSKILSIRETTSEGRMARISFEFVQVERSVFPSIIQDITEEIESAANETLQILKDGFSTAWDVAGSPLNVINAAKSSLDSAINFIGNVKKNAKKTFNYQNELRILNARFEDLVLSGADLSESLINLLKADNSENDFSEYSFRSRFYENINATEYEGGGTFQSSASNSNDDNLKNFIIQTSAALSIKNIASLKIVSVNDAKILKSILTDKFDNILYTASDDSFLKLSDLLALGQRSIDERSERLPFIKDIFLSSTLPSLYLSYDFYEDLSRETEILLRNNVFHPGFISGQPLEILSE